MRLETMTSYGDRAARVVRYIADHLDDRLSLDDLSDVAALSPYHFHRVYRAMQGETTAQTVRRLRLHRAAWALIESEAAIARIASQAGYSSTKMYGVYLDDPDSTPVADLRSYAGFTVPEGFKFGDGVERLVLQAGEIATVVHKGPYAELPRAYAHLYSQWLPSSGREPADQPCFELYLNNPPQVPPTEWLTEVALPLKM